MNAAFDSFPELEYGQWWGNAQRRDYNGATGYELHNCVEVGEPFERLMDGPGWIEYVRHYCGEEESYVAGLFIDECIASIRRSGGHHPVHSGGYRAALRNKYNYDHGVFRCGQCNIILALTDVGPGDGPTMVIPGSHKSNFPHPNAGDYGKLERMDTLEGQCRCIWRRETPFCLWMASCTAAAAAPTATGERRVTIYRYGPIWGSTRYGYQYSQDLLDRLTPERRKLLQPVPPSRPSLKRKHRNERTESALQA